MTDKQIIRELASHIAEIAALPIQEEKRSMWRGLNALKPERPMVMVDQVCWNEMNIDNELTLLCQDTTLRGWEEQLRRVLYQWKHFPVDKVVENFFRVPKAISGTDFGVFSNESHLATDTTNDVISHAYHNQFNDISDVDKIKTPVIVHNEAETNRRQALAEEMFDGLLTVRMEGVDPYLSVWDPISMWMGVEGVLYALADDPDMMRAIAEKVVAGYMSMLDQLTAQGLLCGPQSLIHCTGAWTDELPATQASTTHDLWMFGLAQMFSTVSPAMFNEFEVDICRPIFERFGLVYYGCCDPLDLKMDEVRRIPHVRKVSMSPWADKTRGAAAIGRDFVFSHKPNPAYLAAFDESVVRNDLRETVHICKQNGCPLELIQKDVSTVRYKPESLWRWAQLAMEAVSV